MYIENSGEMSFTNVKTSDTGILKLKKRSWTNKGACETVGEIHDHTGLLRYTIKARWDKNFIIIEPKTNKE
jgi:hypothetical protein